MLGAYEPAALCLHILKFTFLLVCAYPYTLSLFSRGNACIFGRIWWLCPWLCCSFFWRDGITKFGDNFNNFEKSCAVIWMSASWIHKINKSTLWSRLWAPRPTCPNDSDILWQYHWGASTAQVWTCREATYLPSFCLILSNVDLVMWQLLSFKGKLSC